MHTEKDIQSDDKRLADIRFRPVPNTDESRECFVSERLFDGGVNTALILTALDGVEQRCRKLFVSVGALRDNDKISDASIVYLWRKSRDSSLVHREI